MVTFVWIDRELAIYYMCNLDWASILYLTYLTALTLVYVKQWNTLTDDTKVIEVWLYTVVWTTANSDLELVW